MQSASANPSFEGWSAGYACGIAIHSGAAPNDLDANFVREHEPPIQTSPHTHVRLEGGSSAILSDTVFDRLEFQGIRESLLDHVVG
jgi:hypothetical protein